MMQTKTIIPIEQDLWQVTSEPGDATQYTYYVHLGYNNVYHFMPRNVQIRYPAHLTLETLCVLDKNYIEDDDHIVSQLAKDFNCNPWTILECIRTVKELNDVH
jgi:hypothetical protein